MNFKQSRRGWMKAAGAILLPYAGSGRTLDSERSFKLSLNAYSFNKSLTEGRMTLSDLLDFCGQQQLDGADLTAYYFPGYPRVPSDDFLFELKRKAFRLGVAITGTGVRNEFVDPDEKKRQDSIQLVKNWIKAASKIGAPVIRIFAGHLSHDGYSREQVLSWMVKDIRECVEFGRKNGVVVAVQNHNAFLKTADETIELIEKVDSPWFGLILDIGSFRGGDPYQEIEKCIPFAVSWQVKELVYRNGIEEKVDLKKLFGIIKTSSYQGYLPIETLGPGDPFQKVPVFLAEARTAMKGE